MPKYTLYHTDGCHLCEQAHDILMSIAGPEDVVMQDIMTDDALLAEFQVHIPVVKVHHTDELVYWPFTANDVK